MTVTDDNDAFLMVRIGSALLTSPSTLKALYDSTKAKLVFTV